MRILVCTLILGLNNKKRKFSEVNFNFLMMFETCLLKVRDLSNSTPRYLTDLAQGIGVLLI